MIEIKDVFKSYKNYDVLKGVSIKIFPKECVGLVGKNGSGKSTLMRILAQIDKCDKGDILENQLSVMGNKEFLKTKMGYVPQEDALAGFLTVKQQLEFWQSAVGKKDEHVIEALGVDEMWKKSIKSLSGGQKKRVSIAMALQSNPKFLVMDEAFSALDIEYTEKASIILKEKLSDGAMIFWCSHNVSELKSLCSSCVILENGVLSTIKVDNVSSYLMN